MERMGTLTLVIVALACLSAVEAHKMTMGHMITWVDSEVWSLWGVYRKFSDYGCYCGEGAGHGNWKPVDPVDNCCKTHDECYKMLVDKNVCPANKVDQSYNYKKYKEHGVAKLQCTSDPHRDACKYQLCLCDVKVAECFAANEPHYVSGHSGYKKSRCETIAD